MKFEIPLKVTAKTSGNSREHWAAKAKRVKEQRQTTALAWRAAGITGSVFPMLPVVATLTRIAPKALDKHDNLRAGLKPCVDELARLLGLDDADPRVEWRYAQERGKPKEYAVRVSIEPVEVFGESGVC